MHNGDKCEGAIVHLFLVLERAWWPGWMRVEVEADVVRRHWERPEVMRDASFYFVVQVRCSLNGASTLF